MLLHSPIWPPTGVAIPSFGYPVLLAWLPAPWSRGPMSLVHKTACWVLLERSSQEGQTSCSDFLGPTVILPPRTFICFSLPSSPRLWSLQQMLTEHPRISTLSLLKVHIFPFNGMDALETLWVSCYFTADFRCWGPAQQPSKHHLRSHNGASCSCFLVLLALFWACPSPSHSPVFSWTHQFPQLVSLSSTLTFILKWLPCPYFSSS